MNKEYTVIRHVRLVDGSGKAAVEDAIVAFVNDVDDITKDHLVYCGSSENFDEQMLQDGEVFTLDLGDDTYTILPGLINTHVHLDLNLPYLDHYDDPWGDSYRAMVTYRRACEALLCGNDNCAWCRNSRCIRDCST